MAFAISILLLISFPFRLCQYDNRNFTITENIVIIMASIEGMVDFVLYHKSATDEKTSYAPIKNMKKDSSLVAIASTRLYP